MTRVALNRQRAFSVWKFGAKCRSLPCILRSKEYTSHRLLDRPIRDKIVFREIQSFLLSGNFGASSYLFFSTLGKGDNRRMQYRGDINKLLNTGETS